ncbi:MAG TPA: OsmC family peroxiredoxin [Mycobacteriales bacterium]|jgi:osmotically inducible protein OsmC|nr:OsmC family peroxiredoxin [Mycobacteriales bacterium]
MPSRDATTHWTGSLTEGKGHVTLDSSNAGQYDVSWPSRSGDPDGQTSPEELIAAAHSSCLAMSVAGALGREGLTADSIDVSSEVTIDKVEGGFAITGVDVTLRASVPGIEADRFVELARAASKSCPVSQALAGTTITLDAALA